MFGDRRKLRKMQQIVEQQQRTLEEAAVRMKNMPVLIGIDREGRTNKFTFIRNEQVIQIETMGLIGDDLKGWKEQLLR